MPRQALSSFIVSDFCLFDKVAVQDLLCRSHLNTTRETSPCSGGIHSVGDSLSFGSKADYLLENGFTFFVDCAAYNGSKVVV